MDKTAKQMRKITEAAVNGTACDKKTFRYLMHEIEEAAKKGVCNCSFKFYGKEASTTFASPIILKLKSLGYKVSTAFYDAPSPRTDESFRKITVFW